ncbi:hypothetical protein NLU13_7130 [Sarocladium strictum]|uniref:Glycosyltransferase family 32 protein n=1 Tax=Sarocladium strictum TaxID=5046 RepID=A0AA39L6N9_SARSR|nr:hypothetical protein NLU13_7130 [Sarocladium strictum]
MRARTVKYVAIAAVLLVFLSLYEHIRQVGEVVRTYATFHRMIRTNPDLLYRYPQAVDSKPVVPKKMHLIALGNANLTKYKDAIQTCRDLHGDWEHNMWTDDNATEFLTAHYPDIVPHYTGYHQNIQRANILRYALLHHFGGVYLDLDVSCHVVLDDTPLVKLPFVSPGAHPAGVNNAFIATKPGHPFLGLALANVPRYDMYWGLPMRIPYVENMLSTGCMYFSNRWMDYARDLLAGSGLDRVYILANEEGDMAPHMLRGKITTPIFTHGGASSWHGWDAAMLLLIGNHYMIFLFGAVVLVSAVTAFIFYRCVNGRKRAGYRKIEV